ncbi:bifunctional aspartate kinase/homoserine dehydrogenase I [Brucepastera parasyntrophica]|uniref:bifunctional aspartate kinase/homoserine dehydrogenase I n=1 Tax=Brucepastera parasyntrophica TaxID=2880008 RepID=UPI002109329E|nr:bifunctional aspartate kinase/homoserine dehydrogenase I [Brucepastera parasyntrophica]ULQ60343.1 bifunctional aspartate kinase/homoserine dehydrogenase I [Brucepastera parasyntrophica]
MLVMKFGGTSMGNAARMMNSADIICKRSENNRLGVIVSAVGGISNRLQESIQLSQAFFSAGPESPVLTRSQAGTFVNTGEIVQSVKQVHDDIISDLQSVLPEFDASSVQAVLQEYYQEYGRLLAAVAAFGECPDTVECRIMGLGEQLCVPVFAEVLRRRGEDVEVLDSRKYIVTEGLLREGDPVIDKIEENFSPLRNEGAHILLAPGFISSDVSGKPSLLGRNGSDFSAALMALGLGAEKLEIWSDVDGIFTADPRIVPDAVLVNDISYEEAMELSFFGSKVLHPKTISPIAACGIETWSLNSFNPDARGTRIASANTIPQDPLAGPVRGITCLKNTALISVSGSGLRGKKGTAARLFSAVSRSGASILLITQSSSEYTISFCVRASEAKDVKHALQNEFALEIRENLINQISIMKDMAIVSIVGDGMRQRKGVAGTFFSALAFGGINIQAIAQGSSERSISTVVAEEDGDKAVRITHRYFFKTMQTIEAFLFGVGTVGSKLLDQIHNQQQELKKNHIDLQVWGIADSHKMVIAKSGISLEKWKDLLSRSDEQTSVDVLLDFVRAEKPLNPVFIDCSAAFTLPERYSDIFAAGMNIATPNKLANASSMDFYRSIRTAMVINRKQFLYETNVGAGLPIINTFRNMIHSGDSLIKFSGIMSGSMSYIFGRLEEGALFSQAVLEAREKGFTEPDPRDDLLGMDITRKTLILAREAGYSLELEDIKVTSIFPENFDISGSPAEFMGRLSSVDSYFSAWIDNLKNEGTKLRYVATISETGEASPQIWAGPMPVALGDPLAQIGGGENAYVFTTKYYSPIPLVIHGYGAGADVTAAGILADILRTAVW